MRAFVAVLSRKPATLKLDTKPLGVLVNVNGEPVAKLPCRSAVKKNSCVVPVPVNVINGELEYGFPKSGVVFTGSIAVFKLMIWPP